MDERPPIFSWHHTGMASVEIVRKSGLYGSEHVCTIIVRHDGAHDIRSLANALCQSLEAQLPPAEPSD